MPSWSMVACAVPPGAMAHAPAPRAVPFCSAAATGAKTPFLGSNCGNHQFFIAARSRGKSSSAAGTMSQVMLCSYRPMRCGNWSSCLPLILVSAAHKCAACGLPISVATLGDAIAASSDDRRHHVIVAICRRCASSARRLPHGVYRKMLARAADRALADPERYLCSPVADAGAAQLAIGMLGHPAHVLDALKALGWGDGMDQPN